MHETSIYKIVKQVIIQHHLIVQGDTIIVGLSGGVDSMVLLSILNEYRKECFFDLRAAHLIHEWHERSDEEKQELFFCEEVCAQLHIPLTLERSSRISLDSSKLKSMRNSKEALGRLQRHTFLHSLSCLYNNAKIAFAHHRDDDIETFFIRLIRGCSFEGAAGIDYFSGNIIHPFLGVTKKEIYDFADLFKIPYHTDKSNKKNTCLRNKIRNDLLPALFEIDSRAFTSLASSINNFKKARFFIKKQIAEAKSKVFSNNILLLDSFYSLDYFLQEEISIRILFDMGYRGTMSSAVLHEMFRFFKNRKSKHHTMLNIYMYKETSITVSFKKIT